MNTSVGYNTVIEVVPPRAERRRELAEARRRARYGKSGFVDNASYVPFAVRQRTNLDGTAHPKPFTADELHARAVARRNQLVESVVALGKLKAISTHELSRRLDDRAPHANRSTAERPHKDRSIGEARNKLAFAKGLLNNANGLHANGKKMPGHYLNRGARERILDALSNQEAPLAMAA